MVKLAVNALYADSVLLAGDKRAAALAKQTAAAGLMPRYNETFSFAVLL